MAVRADRKNNGDHSSEFDRCRNSAASRLTSARTPTPRGTSEDLGLDGILLADAPSAGGVHSLSGL
jgi:hypothetical protein